MKKILYVDFDSTLVDSVTASVNVWNYLFREPNQPMADPSLLRRWDMTDQCVGITPSVLTRVFESRLFFQWLDPHDGVLETLAELKEDGYKIVIHSIGTLTNLSEKSKYIKKTFGGLFDGLLLMYNGEGVTMNKAIFDFSDGVILDDHVKNLESSNAKYKICAKMSEGDWNENWTGLQIKSFPDIIEELKNIGQKEGFN